MGLQLNAGQYKDRTDSCYPAAQLCITGDSQISALSGFRPAVPGGREDRSTPSGTDSWQLYQSPGILDQPARLPAFGKHSGTMIGRLSKNDAIFLALIAYLFCRCRHWLVGKYVLISKPQLCNDMIMRNVGCRHASELAVGRRSRHEA